MGARSQIFTAVIIFVLGLYTGCGGGGGKQDGGLDADGGNGDLPGDPGGADLDLGEDFAILVPAGTQICTMCGYLNDVVPEYEHKGRITLAPGLIRLPRSQDSLEVDWIQKIELGPARTLALSQGPGRFDRTLQGSPDNGTYRYEFTQPFLVDGNAFNIMFSADFEVENKTAANPVLSLDPQTLSVNPWSSSSTIPFELKAEWQDPSSPLGKVVQKYSACNYDFFHPTEVEVDIQGGDQLRMSFRCPDHSSTIVILSTVCPCPLASASFTSGGQQRDIQDHFRLVFISWNHCNISQHSLIVIDQPLSGVSAISVPGGAYSDVAGYPPTQLDYLDENFQLIETRAITNWRNW